MKRDILKDEATIEYKNTHTHRRERGSMEETKLKMNKTLEPGKDLEQ